MDALVVGTGWPEFRSLDFDRIKHLLKRPVIVDTKNLLDSVRLRAMGFEYVGVGRGQILLPQSTIPSENVHRKRASHYATANCSGYAVSDSSHPSCYNR